MRYLTITATEIAPLLRWSISHMDGEWAKQAEWESPPVDARGIVIEDCVFADTETGLVVVKVDGKLRIQEFKAPLTVQVK